MCLYKIDEWIFSSISEVQFTLNDILISVFSSLIECSFEGAICHVMLCSFAMVSKLCQMYEKLQLMSKISSLLIKPCWLIILNNFAYCLDLQIAFNLRHCLWTEGCAPTTGNCDELSFHFQIDCSNSNVRLQPHNLCLALNFRVSRNHHVNIPLITRDSWNSLPVLE